MIHTLQSRSRRARLRSAASLRVSGKPSPQQVREFPRGRAAMCQAAAIVWPHQPAARKPLAVFSRYYVINSG